MLRRFISSEIFWVGIMVVVLYGCAYGPIYYNYQHPIEGRTYLGFTITPIDTLGNMGAVQKGFAGNWVKNSTITTAIPSEGIFYKLEYLSIGHIARIFHIDPFIMFKLTLIGLSLVYISVIYFVVSRLFPQSIFRILAMGMVLFTTGIGVGGDNQFNGVGGDMLVFQRTTILQPHYMIAAILSVLTIYFFNQILETKQIRWVYFTLLAGFIVSSVFAPAQVMIYIALPIYVLLRVLKHKQIHILVKDVVITSVYYAVTILPILYIRSFRNIFDFNTFTKSESMLNFPVGLTEYLLSIGLILVPIILTIPCIVRTKQSFIKLLFSFCLVHPFAVLILSTKLGISQARFLQTPYFVMFSLCGAWGIWRLYTLLFHRIPRGILAIIIAYLVVLFGSGIFVYKNSLTYMTAYQPWDYYDLGYPYTDEIDAFRWFSSYGDKDAIVLSDMMAGTLLQAFTTKRAYTTTWFGATLDSTVAENILYPVRRFFKEEMDNDEASKFLSAHDIDYVFFGEDELSHLYYSKGKNMLTYPVLSEVYAKGKVRIYKVDTQKPSLP